MEIISIEYKDSYCGQEMNLTYERLSFFDISLIIELKK